MASTLRYQDYQFQISLPSGMWQWTTRIDVSSGTVQMQIRDITSPFGMLRDSIPLPGEVVDAMSASLAQARSAFIPRIALDTSALSFVVDEGRGLSDPQLVQLTNSGVLGSLLDASITTSDSFIHQLPANMNGLLVNASASFEVSVDSSDLLSASSPYDGSVTVSSLTATNSPVTVPVSVLVRPKATIEIDSPTQEFDAVAGATESIMQMLVITNSGMPASLLEYQVRALGSSAWIESVTPSSGTINGGDIQQVVVSVNPSGLVAGSYVDTIRVSGFSTNGPVDVPVTLVLS